ncbi:hypothetical protein ACFQU2_16480 [Siccirubricoccus deserti]
MPFKAPRDDPTGPDAAKEARRLRLHQRILRDFGRIALDDLEIGPLLQRAVAQAARATGVRHTKLCATGPSKATCWPRPDSAGGRALSARLGSASMRRRPRSRPTNRPAGADR